MANFKSHILTISILLFTTLTFSQETLLDSVRYYNDGTTYPVTYSYDQNNKLDTVFYPNAIRIYSNDTLLSIIDQWGFRRFEYKSGFVNEYLTIDSIEFLKSVCIVDTNNQVHERRFYLMDGTLDYTDNYEWDTEGNCTKKNNIEYYYDSEKFNPFYKEYRYWKIGTAGSINCLDESIDEAGTTEYTYGYPMIGRYPRSVTIENPGSGYDTRWYYYQQLEVPTVREVYDFEIGDIYHSSVNYNDYNTGYNSTTYKNHTIIDKYYSDNDDTLFYFEKVNLERTINGLGTFHNSYTKLIEHTNLDSKINTNYINWTFADSNLYNGRVVHMAHFEIGTSYYYELIYVNGFGSVKYREISLPYESEYYTSTFYVKKGDEEWGVPYEIILPPSPIDTLTIGEAFDFNVGDILHYAFDNWDAEGYRNNSLIKKYFSTDNDTVYYIWNILEEGDSTAWWHPDIPYQIEYYDTTMYTNLDSNIRTICLFTHHPLYYTEYIYNNNYEYNDRNVFGIRYYTSYSDPTFYDQLRFKHSRSLGRVVFENNESGNIYFSDSLIYYNKSGEEWGNPHNILGIDDELTMGKFEVISTEYFDFQGRNISKPEEGLYIEVITTTKGIITRKYYVR